MVAHAAVARMGGVRDLGAIADLVEALEEAAGFSEAADRMVSWAREVSGCSTGFLRLTHEDDGCAWVPASAYQGENIGLLRDEAMVDTDECICGQVAVGAAHPSGPFYTENGSFVWGRLSTIEAECGSDALVGIRGRCLQEGFESLGVFPLGGHDHPVGSLHLADHEADRFDGSVELLETGCRLAGRLLLRYESRERERAAFDLVQRALLPDHPFDIRGLDVRVCFDSATELAHIGGDFYEIVELPQDRTLLLVGDYSGRGVGAVGMATRTRYIMAGLAHEHEQPAELLAAANPVIARILPPERFLSAVACVIDPAAGSATIALAGHPPPGVLSGSNAVEVDAPSNPPLGIMPEATYREVTVALTPDDVLLLFTDGVTESRREGGLFGFAGIARTCRHFRVGEPTGESTLEPDVADPSREDQDPAAIAVGRGCATDPSDDLEGLACAICEASAAYHDPDLPADDRLTLAARLWR